MADNVSVSAGSYTATVAADDIGGVHYQRSKLVWGPDGTANDADVASGKPLPVQLRASGGTELALALDATLTGGTQQAIARGGAKGATAAATLTSRAVDADHQALDVYFNNTISATVDSILSLSTRKLSALGTYTTAIAGAGVAPTLKALASNGMKIGNEIDLTGSSARNLYVNLDLLCRGAAAFTAGTVVEVYFILTVDGTNYADASDSVAPPLTALVAQFPLRAVDTAQRIAFGSIPLPNAKFKPLVWNKGGQAFTNTDNENVLSYRVYDLANV